MSYCWQQIFFFFSKVIITIKCYFLFIQTKKNCLLYSNKRVFKVFIKVIFFDVVVVAKSDVHLEQGICFFRISINYKKQDWSTDLYPSSASNFFGLGGSLTLINSCHLFRGYDILLNSSSAYQVAITFFFF